MGMTYAGEARESLETPSSLNTGRGGGNGARDDDAARRGGGGSVGQGLSMMKLWAQVAQHVGRGGGEGGGGDVTMDAVQRAVLRAAGFTWDEATGGLTSWPAEVVASPAPHPHEVGALRNGVGARVSCPIDLRSPCERERAGETGGGSGGPRLEVDDDDVDAGVTHIRASPTSLLRPPPHVREGGEEEEVRGVCARSEQSEGEEKKEEEEVCIGKQFDEDEKEEEEEEEEEPDNCVPSPGNGAGASSIVTLEGDCDSPESVAVPDSASPPPPPAVAPAVSERDGVRGGGGGRGGGEEEGVLDIVHPGLMSVGAGGRGGRGERGRGVSATIDAVAARTESTRGSGHHRSPFKDVSNSDSDSGSSPLEIAVPGRNNRQKKRSKKSPPKNGRGGGGGSAAMATAVTNGELAEVAHAAASPTPSPEPLQALIAAEPLRPEDDRPTSSQPPPPLPRPTTNAPAAWERKYSRAAGSGGPQQPPLQPPPFANMSVDELTRELARHGMKPGPRGYMVGALLQVWATTAAEAAAPLGSANAVDVDNGDDDDDDDDDGNGDSDGNDDDDDNDGNDGNDDNDDDDGNDDESASREVEVGAEECGSQGDRNLYWDDGGGAYDDDKDHEGNEENVDNVNHHRATGDRGAFAAPAAVTKPAPANHGRDIARAPAGVVSSKRKASKPVKPSPAPLEDRLGLWIKSQPAVYDRILLMETVDVDDLHEALVAESAGTTTAGVGCKVPRTKLLAYLEAEGVAVQQTKSRKVRQAKYGNVHF